MCMVCYGSDFGCMPCQGSERAAATVSMMPVERREAERCRRLLRCTRRWPWAACAAQESLFSALARDDGHVSRSNIITIIIRPPGA